MKLTALGTRGSMPITGKEYLIYGGDTTSYLLETETQVVFLDAGTGIMHAPPTEKKISVLISHTHLDHIMGFPFFKALSEKNRVIDIYGATREGLTIRDQIYELMAPPLWPVGIDAYAADISFHETREYMRIGEAEINTLDTRHPGGCTAFKITAEGRTVVFTGDYEHDNGEGDAALVEFSRDADLLIFDAQYSAEEYEFKRGFGHSTPEKGLEIQALSGAKKLLFTHHDPFHEDAYLMEVEAGIQQNNCHAAFAREGEVIAL